MTETPPRPARLPTLLRRWGPRAIFEMLLIVFSISLALGLNAWVQDMQTQHRVATARAALVEEIEANRERLLSAAYIPHHRRLQGNFGDVDWNAPMRLDVPGNPVMAAFETGVHNAQLREAVWQSVQTQGLLEHMPQDDVFALYDAYRAQSQLEAINMAYYPVLAQTPLQLRSSGGDIRGVAMSLQLYLGDVVAGEEAIVRLQEAALEELRD